MILRNDLGAFFSEHVRKAQGRRNCGLSAQAASYLTILLSDSVRSDSGPDLRSPLCLMVADAANQAGVARVQAMRMAGDSALMRLGFFRSSLIRRSVSVHYLASLGAACYAACVPLNQSKDFTHLQAIAQEFLPAVSVLQDVARSISPGQGADESLTILAAYEDMTLLGSRNAEAFLIEMGIHPVSLSADDLLPM
jgi:hypothetical protein